MSIRRERVSRAASLRSPSGPSLPVRAVRKVRFVARRWRARLERAWLDRDRLPVPDAVRGAPIRVLLYCPADLNLVDGSSIWVQSVAATLVTDPAVAVTLPLRRPETRDVITAALLAR
jgi:hypothetical protein